MKRDARQNDPLGTWKDEMRLQAWEKIKGKAHLYTTAYSIWTHEYVKILGVRSVGVFVCQHCDGETIDYGCEDLEHYCL